MSYTKLYDYAAKDLLIHGDPAKAVKGTELGAEFDAIAVADALNVKTSTKDATGGYAGLTLFKINFKNAANTFTNFLTNATTAARTYTFQDRNGTIADDTDLATKAALAGSASQTFSVAAAVATTDAVQLNQIAGTYPAIASAATIDIFAIAGAAVSISGTTTVTAITACTAAQVGSIKTLVPSNAAGFSITATANIVVDGATSGTYLMPKDANVQIIATSTSTFKITTIFASGTWTPAQGAGLTVVGAFSSSGAWTKIGRLVLAQGVLSGATSVAFSANSQITSTPFAGGSGVSCVGGAVNGALNVGVNIYASGSIVYAGAAMSATPNVPFTFSFTV